MLHGEAMLVAGVAKSAPPLRRQGRHETDDPSCRLLRDEAAIRINGELLRHGTLLLFSGTKKFRKTA
jgi:hypothetical protein